MEALTDIDKNEMFIYLDELRNSGVTNMLGAGPFLADEFDLDRKTAGKVLSDWMGTYSTRHKKD